MSYFPIEARDLDKNPHRSTVGPGQYLSQDTLLKKHAYAPFGSLSPKKYKINMQHTLGPGQYPLNRDLLPPSVNKY